MKLLMGKVKKVRTCDVSAFLAFFLFISVAKYLARWR